MLLFIAEIAGVLSEDLKNAYRIVKVYENANQLRNKDKNGNYMWGKEAFRDFKSKIHINDVVKIIKDTENWDVVRVETKNYRKHNLLIHIPICRATVTSHYVYYISLALNVKNELRIVCVEILK